MQISVMPASIGINNFILPVALSDSEPESGIRRFNIIFQGFHTKAKKILQKNIFRLKYQASTLYRLKNAD
jgi:hypothetical protein